MGNCLRRPKKTNRVEPAPAETEDIHEVLSKATEFRKQNKNDPADMLAALKHEETDNENKDSAPATDKAVAFTVDLGEEVAAPKKMPKRLAERIAAEKEPKGEIEYTCTTEEELLMAEVLRADALKERQEKAIKEDIKVFDAKRKRMALEKSREAQLQDKLRSSTPSVTDQRQKVKDMAEEDRRKAAERRRAADKPE